MQNFTKFSIFKSPIAISLIVSQIPPLKPLLPFSPTPVESDSEEKKLIIQLKKDHTVKDLTQKLSNLPLSPQEDKPQNRIGDMSGLISKAKEGLAKSKSNKDISRSPSVDSDIKKLGGEQKKSENELHWEEIVKNMTRKLNLCDLDFTDLTSDDDKDVLAPRGFGGAVPPPPPPGGLMPPMMGVMPPPPSMMMRPPPTNLMAPMFPNGGGLANPAAMTNGGGDTIKKNKKTVSIPKNFCRFLCSPTKFILFYTRSYGHSMSN